jgi:hypothetical protein
MQNLIRKAARQKAKIRLGFSSVSGGGKTLSALLVAFGLVGDWSKIGVIDTENESADLYVGKTMPDGTVIGEFLTLPLKAPYTPERYIEGFNAFVSAGVEIIITDSITHEWDGKGGCLDIVQALGGQYAQWAKVTPRHQDFIDAIVQSPVHMFTTVRRKQDYEMSKGENGKATVTKLGLKEVTRDGFEYELTANLEIESNHYATASKDRTGLFAGRPPFLPSVETGKMLKAWCESGAEPLPPTSRSAPQAKETLTQEHAQWGAVTDALLNKGYTVTQVKLKYTVEPEVEAVLNAVVLARAPKAASPAAQPATPQPVTQHQIHQANASYVPPAGSVLSPDGSRATAKAKPF